MPPALDTICEALAAWPKAALSSDEVLAVVCARIGPDPTPEALADLRLDDIVLACAAARGDPDALAAFEALLGEARAALGRLKLPAEAVVDVLQDLRCDLLTAAPGEKPGIDAYSGRGRLGAWLRVVAVRTALKTARRDARVVPAEDELLEAVAPGRDAELDALRNIYSSELEAAFATAFGELTPRQRTLLRHSLVDRLGIDAIAGVYRVHRATAARWLADARDEVIGRTRQAMMTKLRIGQSKLESIFRLVRSECDASIYRLLRQPSVGGARPV